MKILTGLAAFAASLTLSAAQANDSMNLTRPSQDQVQYAQELPATLVVRINQRTNEMEVLNSYSRLQKDADTVEKVQQQKFKKMSAKDKMRGKGRGHNLDSIFSWLLGFASYSYNSPYYSYRDYSYPYSYYDSYSYNGYSYYYYGYPYAW